MNGLTLSQIATAILGALLFGGSLGFIYKEVKNTVCILIFSLRSIFIKNGTGGTFRVKEYFKRAFNAPDYRLNFVTEEIYNFLFLIMFGVCATVAMYILTDGVVRIFVVLFMTCAFFTAKKICKFLDIKILKTVSFLLSLILLPLTFLIFVWKIPVFSKKR